MANVSGIPAPRLLSTTNQMTNAAAGNTNRATGSMNGRNLTQIKTPQSMIDNASEELTTSLESKSSDDFAIKDRKRQGKGSDSLLKMVQEYTELTNDDTRNAKRAMLSQVLHASQSSQDVLEKTLEQFSNKTDAWASLAEIAQEYGAESPQPTGLKSVLDAMETLENEFGDEIKAGLKGALNSKEFTDIGSAAQLRDLYTTTVTITAAPDAVLARLLEEYESDDDLDRAIDFLLSTLGGELESADPSMDKVHLQSVMGDIEKTQQLHSSHKQCTTALSRWKEKHKGGGENSTLTPLEMMRELIALKNENFISPSSIDKIVDQADPQDIEKEVLFLQEMLAAVRKFPIMVFDNVENRVRVMGAVQDAVDDAVRREDEFLFQKEHPDVPLQPDENNIQ